MGQDNSLEIKCVIFDCDGVLVDSVSSWKTLHDHFGTDNSLNLTRFINGELTDVEFMSSDIKMWKEKSNPIYRDELFRAYSGVKLMNGARELVSELKEKGIFVAIVSAGVDIFVSSIAAMLKADDWIANGFHFNDDDTLSDEGICRLHASKKDLIIEKIINMQGLSPQNCISVGDSEMDLSMQVEGSGFVGFNPSRESSFKAFKEAGVPIIEEKNLLLLRPYFGLE